MTLIVHGYNIRQGDLKKRLDFSCHMGPNKNLLGGTTSAYLQ